jgi:hypothetical protein
MRSSLLRAGAKTPSGRAALDKLIQWAEDNKASELVNALRERSSAAGAAAEGAGARMPPRQ